MRRIRNCTVQINASCLSSTANVQQRGEGQARTEIDIGIDR